MVNKLVFLLLLICNSNSPEASNNIIIMLLIILPCLNDKHISFIVSCSKRCYWFEPTFLVSETHHSPLKENLQVCLWFILYFSHFFLYFCFLTISVIENSGNYNHVPNPHPDMKKMCALFLQIYSLDQHRKRKMPLTVLGLRNLFGSHL